MLTTTRELRILIIDDDDVDRERVRRCLACSTLLTQISEADSGHQAVGVLCQEPVDCVLLDNCLGDTTGAALLKDIRVRTPYRGPVIMVTGAGNDALFVETMHEGAADYVPKHQLEAERLAQAILRSLKSHESLAVEQAAAQRLERRIAEQEQRMRQLDRTLQDILDQAPNVIGYWDQDERVRFGNVLHRVWFGVAAHDLVDMQVSQLLGPELYAIHAPHIQQALLGQPQRFEHSMPVLGSQDTRVVRVDYLPDMDANNRTQGFYVTWSDLTELARARDAAEASARLRQTFLANMSHEIRTPMNAILGLLRLTLDKPLAPDARHLVSHAHEASLALMHILDDILDHARLEAGKLAFDPQPFQVDALILRSLDLFAERIAQKGLDLVVDVSPDFPTAIKADSLRIAQVLNNLLGNAVKFTEHGSISLRLRMLLHPTRLRFEVADTGSGIDFDQQAELFSPFTQADSSVTRRHGGSGLGLSICRSLVQLMSGDIGVTSHPAMGSTFWFELPHEPCALPDPDVLPVDGLTIIYWTQRSAVPGAWARHKPLNTQGWRMARTLAEVESLLLNSTRACQLLVDLALPLNDLAPTLQALMSRMPWWREPHPGILLLLPCDVPRARLSGVAFPEHVSTLQQPVLAGTLSHHLAALQMPHHDTMSLPDTPPLWSDSAQLKGARVLLVEDNFMNQMVAQAFLQQMEMLVTTVGDGQQAVDCINQAKPGEFDVILMDMHMPVMDGLTATEKIRNMPGWQSCPIIAMTAAVLADDQQRCTQSGMVDLIAKPIIAEQLVATLEKWVGRREG